MNFSLCLPSSSDLTSPSVEGFHFVKPLRRFDRIRWNNKKMIFKSCGKNTKICCHLMSEGSYVGNKKLELGREREREVGHVRTLLIDNYDSYTYNIYQELSVVNGVPPVVIQNDEWTWEQMYHCLYIEKAFDNIVISPGPGSPSCAEDVGICLRLLLECRDIPILGVCLGHQALGYVHGARIVHALEPIHGRMSEVEHNGSKLFHNIPSGKSSGFKVVRYHSLVIDAESLPSELIPIAWTSTDSFSFLDTRRFGLMPDGCENKNGVDIAFGTSSTSSKTVTPESVSWSKEADRCKVLMGIMHSTRPHYGVQFHPESIATCYGKQLFENFREMTNEYWLRSNATSINARNLQRMVRMQVPGVSQHFGVHRSLPLVPGDDGQLYQIDAKVKQNTYEKICYSRPTSLLDFSEPCFGRKHLKLKWKKIDRLAAEVGGARNIFCNLFGASNAENTFWLDSSSVEKKRARFSFMGAKGGPLWKRMTFRLSDESNSGTNCGGRLTTEDAEGSIQEVFLEDGFLHYLNQEILSFSYDEDDFQDLPFEFHGGYIGYIGYGLKVECGMHSNRHTSTTPDACFFFADNFVVIDHLYDDVYIMSIQDGNTTTTEFLDETETSILSLKASSKKMEKVQFSESPVCSSSADFVSEKSKVQYMDDVEKCLEYIRDGESYELCFTSQLRKTAKEVDPLGLYLYLREKNPAPYSAWLNFSKENLSICSSSPERFLRLDRNGVLEAKPIKGTIRRGTDQLEDEKLRLQLQYSEKDQAENLMIVDLLRNDLGRVCEPGSVHVPHLMDVESYATVHTMVSTVRGKKKLNISAVDCVRAAFPGGSMTGAPKLRSMEILDSLESCSRGIYSGSIGFFSYNQTFDLNIVIRTIVIHKGEAAIGAGGAIVALSHPEDEYNEMLLKARAPMNAMAEFAEFQHSDRS